ncbi:MAG: DUF6701 domain-containing protein, partial [Pseudomonas sp.]
MKSWRMGLRLCALLLCLGQSGGAFASLCSAVFPAARTANSGATLDLSAVSWQNSPALGAVDRVRDAGDHYFAGGSTPNDWSITTYGGASTRVFVNGSLSLGNNNRLNAGGNPQDLILVVNGSLTLGNNAQINGFVYVTGSINYGNNLTLNGAITALGATNSPAGSTSLSYAGSAINLADFADLCSWSALLSWSLNESGWSGAANEVQDASGNALHGRSFNGLGNSISSPALPSVNGQGSCRYGVFASSNSHYIQRNDSNSLDLNGRFTIAVWVRPRSRPSELMSILSKDENYEFHLKPNGRVNWWWQTSGPAATREFDSTTSVPLDSWTHVAIRFAPGDQRIYINGVLAGSASYSGTPRSNGDPLQLGQDQGYAGRYFNGDLDELRIYQQALSAAQIQALAQERATCASEIDHYELAYASGNALTCNPLAVTLRACQSSDCSRLYSGSATATLSPSSGWTATAPAVVSGSTITFTGGSVELQYQLTTPDTTTLGVSGNPAATNASQCRVGGVSSSCAVTFADSGFILEVPNLVAAKPTSASIRAVKKDDQTQACVAGFGGGTRTLQFSSAYSNPTTGTQPVSINGVAVGTAPSDVTLNFDAAASAPLTVRYDDAGLMQLNARYAPTSGVENGLLMTGSDQFVAKPYGLCLETNAACTVADVSGNCTAFARAGDDFALRIRAVGWEVDGEDGAALCSGNVVTPNFQLSGIGLSSQVAAPTAGDNGSLRVSSYDHALGNQTEIAQAISEVGVFTLTATPTTSYLGETLSSSRSGYIGRFIPKYLGASGSASLTPSCGLFSYQGQPMAFAGNQEPSLTVTGFNASGGVTTNYDRGDFWRLNTPTRDAYKSVTGLASLDAAGRLTSSGTPSLSVSGADTGDGARTLHWRGETLQYTPAVLPLADDLPFTAAIRQGFASLTDQDGACYGDGSSCRAFSYDFLNSPGSQVRLGRLRLGNAHGSELQGLNLPWVIDSWQGTAASGYFAKETGDSCSAPVLNTPALVAGTFIGNLAAGETTPSLNTLDPAEGQLRLTAPGAGNDGSVEATLS